MDSRSLKKGSALPVSASSDRVCVTKLPKTRERRFRSLQDIYMNSPRCTLEDVEKLSKMTEDYPKSTNRLNGKSGEGQSKKRKYKSTKISGSVGKKLPSESGEAERENHHVEVSSKRNSTSKEKQPQSRSSIKGKEKMCSTGSIRAGNKHIVPLEIIGQMTNPNPNPYPSSRSVWQIPIAVRTEGPLGKTCLPVSCVVDSAPMAAVISSIPDQESQSIVVPGHITSSDEKIQSSVVPTNSINATGHATESTGPSSSSSTGARKLRLFGFNIDPTATDQTCQVTSTDNGLRNNQIDFISINGGDQDAGAHLPHHIIAAQPNMINEFRDNRRLSAAASPIPWASCYMPQVAVPTNINHTAGYYNYPLPAAAAPVLNHIVFMNGLSGFVPSGVAPAGNIIIFQCLPAQSFTSHQLGSFNSQAVTISPTPSWQSGVPASSSRPIRPTPRRFLAPPIFS